MTQTAKRYRFIEIRENGINFNGMPAYGIYNNKTNYELGELSYYRRWKQYVFTANEECVFNASCLRDVIDFLERVSRGG